MAPTPDTGIDTKTNERNETIEQTEVNRERLSDPVDTLQVSTDATDKSQPFIGQWNLLISTTNWDKGAVICQWRTSLSESNAASADFSDEAWSQLVGGVTAQHVGRLRRTYERFGHVFREYDGIYWSHFYASLDWDDAEMWLEGAVQSKWSVSRMRKQRWETLGEIPGNEPRDQDIVASELNEETQSLDLSEGKRQNDRDYVSGPVHEGPDFGDEGAKSDNRSSPGTDGNIAANEDGTTPPKSSAGIRPFESFVDLPDDVEEATSAFKVAIIRHKAGEWSEISQADMTGLLDALKQLAVIPAE